MYHHNKTDITRSGWKRTFPDGTVFEQPKEYWDKSHTDTWSSDLNYGDHKTPMPWKAISSSHTHCHGILYTPYYVHEGNLRSQLGYMDNPGITTDDPSVDAFIEETHNKALSQLQSYLYNYGNDGNPALMVALFESPEMVTLLKQLKSGFKKVKGFKKSLKLKFNPFLTAAEWLLMWKFAIEPLITTYKAIIELLNSDNSNKMKSFVVTKSAKMQHYSISTKDTGTGYEYEEEFVLTVRTTFKARVQVEDWEALFASMAGFANPISAAYAVVPLSFVIDWFLNIGSYIENLEYALTNTAYRYVYVVKSVKVTIQSANTLKSGISKAQMMHSVIKFDRYVTNELPLLYPPKPQINLNSGKMLSLAALFTVFSQSK